MAKEKIVLARLEHKEFNKLEKKIEKEGLNISSYIRRLIRRDLDSVIKVKLK